MPGSACQDAWLQLLSWARIACITDRGTESQESPAGWCSAILPKSLLGAYATRPRLSKPAGRVYALPVSRFCSAICTAHSTCGADGCGTCRLGSRRGTEQVGVCAVVVIAVL